MTGHSEDAGKEYEAVEEYNRNYKQLLRDGKYDEAEETFPADQTTGTEAARKVPTGAGRFCAD